MKEKNFKKGITKRALSVVLALAMVISLMPMNSITAFAASWSSEVVSVADAGDYYYDADVVNDLGSGNFMCGDHSWVVFGGAMDDGWDDCLAAGHWKKYVREDQIGDSTTYWELKDGTLTISGTGAMPDFSVAKDVPWRGKGDIVNVVIQNGVTAIGNKAFNYSNTNIESVTLPDGLLKIGQDAFYNCSKLTGITLPSSLTTIDNYAFCNCSKLTGITLPSSLTTIGNSAFKNCGITNIEIPANVSSMGTEIFYRCSSLTTVTFAEGFSCTTIPESMFQWCNNLANITIPASVTEIGRYAFDECGSLVSVTIPENVTKIDNFVFSKCGFTSITIPASVTEIGPGAFNDCDGLVSVTIPENVTKIGSNAFKGCSNITSITIPASVTEIGNYAFWECSKLADVTVMATTPPTLGDEVFHNTSGNLKIYVPKSSINDYKTSWSAYADKIEAASSTHTHGSWEYTVDGATLTAECKADGDCNLTDNKVALTLTANSANYSGISGLDAFNTATGRTGENVISESNVKFYQVETADTTEGGTAVEGTPSADGYYYAALEITGITPVAKKAFTIGNPVPPTPLTFTAEEAGATMSFKWYKATGVKVKASSANVKLGENQATGDWEVYSKGTVIALPNVGDSVQFQGKDVVTNGSNHFVINNGKITASGDVTSLTNRVGGNVALTTEKCYQNMFDNCISLTSAPNLPSTTLSKYCYDWMFSNCKSLTEAPELPSTTLAAYCYRQMFGDCTGLTNAPELKATKLANNCYQNMFIKCTGIKIAETETQSEATWMFPADVTATNWNTNMISGLTATGTLTAVEAGKMYKVTAAPHEHNWQYTVGTGDDANKLTGTCNATGHIGDPVTLTLSASSPNYSGSAATITIGTATEKTAWTGAGLTVPTAIAYEKAGGDTLTAAPTAVGSYVAKVSPVGVTATEANTAKVSFTIEDNSCFKVGENGYQWFSQAVEAANTSKQPIVLLKDKKTATEVPANKNVTIDLNGHYMKCSDSNSTIVIQANSTVTITDTNTDAYHYFKYKNNDVWEFVEKPENPESAITVEAINSNTADDTLIKVAGGVITGNGITNKGTLVVDGVNIVGNNLTNTNGGAIKNMKGEVTINKGMLLGNKALRGGAIVNDAGKLTIGTEGGNNKNILIAYNNAIDKNPDAEAYGGAIYSYNDGKVTGKQAVVTLNSGEIKYNECERGAGVCGAVIDDTLVSKIIIPSKSTIIISNNKASNGGGGIMLRWGATLEMNAGTITNNSAVKWSGGLDIGDKSKATITGGTIANNSSEQKGGGISVRDNGQLAMSGGSVRNNTAGVAGGGVHFAEKDKVEHGVTFSGSAVVKDNTSGADGSKVTDNVYIGATKNITLGTFGNNGDIGVTLGTTDGRGQFIEGTVTNLAQLSNYHSDKGDLMVDLKEQKGMIVDATHAWQYSENGNQLVAKCKGKAGGCKFDTCGYDKDATAVKLTLTASDATYSGNAVTAEYAEGEAANWKAAHGKDAPAISYEKKGSDNTWTALEAAPEKAGEYRAVATLTVGTDDYTVYKTFKINEADKTALNEAITAAKAAKAAIVTESSVLETLDNAITAAEEVADNKNVTASAIASAKSAMDNAAANATADLIDEIGEVTYSKDSRDKIKSAAAAYAALTADQKALVDGSDVDALEAAESRYKELEAIANSKFLVQAKAGKTALALDWNEVGGAVKYKVYLARCGKRYKLVKTTKGTEFVKSVLKKGKTYKVYVKAYNSKGKKIATTPTAHIITLGGNRSNATKITAVPFMELVKGKTKSVEAKIVSKDGSKTLLSKGHVSKIRYYSSNKSVATVSSSGKVKAVKAGTAYIKAVAPSGVSSVTVVTVTGNVK